jgi:hypothetical protein
MGERLLNELFYVYHTRDVVNKTKCLVKVKLEERRFELL